MRFGVKDLDVISTTKAGRTKAKVDGPGNKAARPGCIQGRVKRKKGRDVRLRSGKAGALLFAPI